MHNIFFKIKEAGERITHKKGGYLFYRGDHGDSFYIIEKGHVELSIFDLNGEKHIISELQRNEFFGHIEAFTNGIHPTNAYATAGTEIICVTSQALKDFVLFNSDKSLEVLNFLCQTIHHNFDKIEDELVLDAYQKVSKKIYELGQKEASENLFINQKRISEFLALSERTTNVSLRKLRENGVISTDRSRIHILDNNKLKQQFQDHRRFL